MNTRNQVRDYLARLELYRSNLVHSLSAKAVFGPGYVPAQVLTSIKNDRTEIARIKFYLRRWGEQVDNHPDDDPDGNITTEVEREELQKQPKDVAPLGEHATEVADVSAPERMVSEPEQPTKRLTTPPDISWQPSFHDSLLNTLEEELQMYDFYWEELGIETNGASARAVGGACAKHNRPLRCGCTANSVRNLLASTMR